MPQKQVEIMRIILTVLVTVFISLGSSNAVTGAEPAGVTKKSPEAEPIRGPGSNGIQKRTVRAGGFDRDYYLYIPHAARDGNAPLVIAFHGGGGKDALRFVERVGLIEMADQHGFIIAAPEGFPDPRTGKRSWNTGSTTPQGYAEEHGIDDLAFVRQIIGDARDSGLADGSRIYALGVSRGGMMAYWAACNLGNRDFAAIAVVAGTLASGECARPKGISLLHIHGTADERVPWHGGSGRFTARDGNWESAAEGVETFASGAGCSHNGTSMQPSPDTTCHRSTCPGSNEVKYCLVEGGGHAWPGVPANGRQRLQGVYSSNSFNATAAIAEFFEKH